MAKHYQSGDATECLSAQIISRNIQQGALVEIPEIEGLCRKFKCDRDSSSEILKSIVEERKFEGTFITVGELLDCRSLSVLTLGTKPPKIALKGGASGRHKAQEINTNVYTYSQIVYPFKNIPEELPAVAVVIENNKIKKKRR